MLESNLAGVDHLNTHVLEASPVGVQTWRQDVAEATFDPDQRTLAVLQVNDLSQISECATLDDDVQLVVLDPRISLRDHVDADLPQRIEQPVPTCGQQSLEFTVAEVQTDFVAANSYSLETTS